MRGQKRRILPVVVILVGLFLACCNFIPNLFEQGRAYAVDVDRQTVAQIVKLTAQQEKSATLTVLIPGLNGGAGHFSNNYIGQRMPKRGEI